MSRVPTFVVQTPDKRWELCAELRDLFEREAVPQRMQNCPQSRVRAALIHPCQILLHGVHPFVRLLHCSVQSFDVAHIALTTLFSWQICALSV
jgi:hypothetical protein